jgi:hypothetical protein
MSEVRCVEPNPFDSTNEVCRKALEERNLIDRVFDDDASGVKLVADVWLALEDGDARASTG